MSRADASAEPALGALLSVTDALARLAEIAPTVGDELVSVADAAGRVLAQDLTARRTQPPFATTAMDGYAVRSADAEPGAELTVTAEIAAGAAPERPLGAGEAHRIFTGAPMPEGADAVVIQEDADRSGARVTLRAGAHAGAWVRPEGLDFRAGDRLLAAPRRLSASDAALAAAAGEAWLRVARRPRATVLPVGDELRLPGDALGPADIVTSNNFGVAALLAEEGVAAAAPPPLPDDLDALRAAIRDAAGADLIVMLGGASEGAHDLSRQAFAAEGMTPAFYKIAMRPGKPLMAGRHGRALVVGLPGNPVSAMVCAEVFLRPIARALQGLPAHPTARRPIPLAIDLPAGGAREHYMRAALEETGDGLRVRPFENQDSSRLRLLARADVLAVRPAGDPPRRAGEPLDCLPLRG